MIVNNKKTIKNHRKIMMKKKMSRQLDKFLKIETKKRIPLKKNLKYTKITLKNNYKQKWKNSKRKKVNINQSQRNNFNNKGKNQKSKNYQKKNNRRNSMRKQKNQILRKSNLNK